VPPLRNDGAAAAAWLFVGLATALTAVAVAYVGAFGAPYWDQWQFVQPRLSLDAVLERHNAHPMLVGRLVFAADYFLFDAQPWFLQLLIFAALGAAIAAFMGLIRLAGWRRWTTFAISGGFAVAMIFSPQGWENLRWGFQVPFVTVFAGALVAVYALASYAAAPRVWKLALSLTCSALAIFSLANGVIIAVLLAVMAIYLRQPWRVTGLYILVALLAIPALTAPSHAPPPSGVSSLYEQMLYVLRFLGGGLALVAGDAMRTSLLIGAGLVVTAATLIGFAVRNGTARKPACAALIAIILFIGASAVVAAMGRAFLGPEQALAGRYVIVGGVLTTSTGLLLALQWGDRITGKARAAVLLVAACAILAIPAKGVLIAERLEARARSELAAQTALVVGVHDESAISRSTFDLELAERESNVLRSAAKWHFEDRWTRMIGRRLKATDVTECAGAVIVERPSADYVRLNGYVSRNVALRARTIVIVDIRGVIRGYGRRANNASDLIGGVFGPSHYAWVGHARTRPRARQILVVYAASDDGVICRIGGFRAPAPPAA
jgi:hypothetical protein